MIDPTFDYTRHSKWYARPHNVNRDLHTPEEISNFLKSLNLHTFNIEFRETGESINNVHKSLNEYCSENEISGLWGCYFAVFDGRDIGHAVMFFENEQDLALWVCRHEQSY